MEVQMSFPGGEKVRELHDTREEVTVDLDANGNMVGLTITGTIGVKITDTAGTVFERRYL
jgi:uncharacterized protein YuzE